jgi:hypothetical protein
MTVANQFLIHEVIKKGLNSDKGCYHLIQNLLASHLLSKNVKIKLYKPIILPLVKVVSDVKGSVYTEGV